MALAQFHRQRQLMILHTKRISNLGLLALVEKKAALRQLREE